MDGLEVIRSTSFVSLDTHPAENALVVTYDVLAIAIDQLTQHEIARASKRHQQLVRISLLDKLTEGGLDNNKLAINVNEISGLIQKSCPLLSDEGHVLTGQKAGQTVEDIRLHLLYLINRRQAQLSAGKDSRPDERPRSSARFASATSTTRSRPASSFSSTSKTKLNNTQSSVVDVYRKYLDSSVDCDQETPEVFHAQFGKHLNEQINPLDSTDSDIKQTYAYLDSLYGPAEERLGVLMKLQKLFAQDEHLASLSEKRLLVCALIRTLNDHNQWQQESSLLIEIPLYCLLRLTQFRDIYERAFGGQANVAPVDLVDSHLEFLSSSVTQLLQQSQSKPTVSSDQSYFITGAQLVMLDNLSQLNRSGLLKSIRKAHLSLVGLLQVSSAQLGHDIRTLSKTDKMERTLVLLRLVVALLRRLSCSREHLSEIRGARKSAKDKQKLPQPLLDTLVALLHRLQTSRPGSGASGQQAGVQVIDSELICAFYQLELMALGLARNLCTDRVIMLRLIKRNLLKCILRNLVSLLASRNELSPFSESPVLMLPLACLYQLTCEQSVRDELCRSRIILRCLFEFLLSSTSCLIRRLSEEPSKSLHGGHTDQERNSTLHEVRLRPSCADFYLLGVWCNLTAGKQGPAPLALISDPNLWEILLEYLESAAKLLELRAKLTACRESLGTLVYLNAKLVANLSFRLATNPLGTQFKSKLLDSYATCCLNYLAQRQVASSECLAVQSLAALSKLLVFDASSVQKPSASSGALAELMGRLFSLQRAEMESESHDDFILVSCLFLASLAQSREICDSPSRGAQLDYAAMVRCSNFLLGNKQSDRAILLACLFALARLTNHRKCRWALPVARQDCEQLTFQLASLMLHSDSSVSGLACQLGNRFVGLLRHEHADTAAPKIRFESYNSKWLAAISASRNELLETSGEWPERDENWLLDEEEPEVLADAGQLGAGQSSSGRMNEALRLEMEDEGAGEEEEEFEQEELEEEILMGSDADSVNAPDLSVVDPNSMIKHLISRRSHRSSGR